MTLKYVSETLMYRSRTIRRSNILSSEQINNTSWARISFS